MRKISMFVTSDTHGQWVSRADYHQLSLLDTAMTLHHHRQACDHPTLTIDLGDFIQGSGLATYFNQERKDGTMFARVMNAMQYDAQLIGNHEFNFGPDYRNHILEQISAPILAANIVDEATGQPVYGQPYRIFDIDGTKVGILGVTTSYIKHWELPKNYQGLEFPDAFETVKAYVHQLRPQVDILVVAYHGGFEKDLITFEPIEPQTGENQGARMIEDIEGIDILLTGHQHRHLAGHTRGVTYLQPGYGGEYIGQIDLEISDDHHLEQAHAHLIPVKDKQDYAPWLKAALDPDFTEGKQWLQFVIGHAPIQSSTDVPFEARLFGHPYAEFLNQIQLKHTGAQFSGVAIVNDAFAKFTGEIRQETLLEAYPFYNLISTVRLTGQDLFDIMEYNMEYFSWTPHGQLRINPKKLDPKPQHYNLDLYSGFTSVVDLTQAFGHRVIDLVDEMTGESLDRDKEYIVAVSQYRAVGGGNYHWFKEDKIIDISEIDIATLIKTQLDTFDASDWEKINQAYQHIVFVNEPFLSQDPMNPEDMAVIESLQEVEDMANNLQAENSTEEETQDLDQHKDSNVYFEKRHEF